MENKTDHMLKLVLNSGQACIVYSNIESLAELVSHPKFLKMNDTVNDIFISIDNVAAFEILSNRKEEPLKPQEQPKIAEGNADTSGACESSQQA